MSIERALEIALGAHAGQTDRAGEPYIMHVIRVMAACKDRDAQIVAALHDVVEDSDWTLNELSFEFPPHIILAVDAITKRGKEPYFNYLRRVSTSKLATAVKIADLADNMRMERLPNPTQKDVDRAAKYQEAYAQLTQLRAGHSSLHSPPLALWIDRAKNA